MTNPNSLLRKAAPIALLLAVFVLSGLGTTAHAQVLKAQILGTISDTSGAVIPGAKIVLTEQQTNSSRESETNESGLYVFTNLDPGLYQVEVELEGFRKSVRRDIDVLPNTTVRVNLALEPGIVTEVVTITDTAPILQTDRADTGAKIEQKQLQELPLLFNRNYQGLLTPVARRGTSLPPALAVLQFAGQPFDAHQRSGPAVQQLPDRGHREQDRQRQPDGPCSAG